MGQKLVDFTLGLLATAMLLSLPATWAAWTKPGLTYVALGGILAGILYCILYAAQEAGRPPPEGWAEQRDAWQELARKGPPPPPPPRRKPSPRW